MVYKRYIKRGNKLYGPYIYHSKKKDGKVISTYLGKHSDYNQKKTSFGSVTLKREGKKKDFNFPLKKLFLVVVISAFLLFFFFSLSNLYFTGKTLSVSDIYSNGFVLQGNLNLVLQQSEFIPSDTKVIINSAGSEYIYNLSDLISDRQQVLGDFYIKEETISGNGYGYIIDNVTRFPYVDFVLGIYKEIPSGSGGEEEEENQTGNQTYTLPIEPENGTQNESGQRGISGNIIFDFFRFLTGKVSLELIEEVHGSVRANESLTYVLDDSYIVQVISSEYDIKLETIGNNVTITTDYTGDEIEGIDINITELNITANQGTLTVSFVYNDTELFSDSKTISNESDTPSEGIRGLPTEPVVPGPEPEPEPPETNETENQTLEGQEYGIFSADMDCYITTPGSCGGIILLYLENETGGYENAHVQNVSVATYAYTVCCNVSGDTLTTSCEDETFLKLSNLTNAHVQQNNYSDYTVDACISSTNGDIGCTYGTCSANQTCLLSISSITNAHVGSCDHYSTNVCCGYLSSIPVIDAPVITPSPAYTNDTLNCSTVANDVNDDNITVNLTWYNSSTYYLSEIKYSINGSTVWSILSPSEIQNKGETWNCSVRAYDGTNYSDWKSTTIIIQNSVPSLPTLDLLIDNANTSDTTPFFNWTISTDEDGDSPITYGIQIANDTGFGAENIVQSNYSLTDNNYTAAVLTEDVYYWRVKAITSDANSSYTSYRTFTIGTTIPTFTDAVNTSVDFKKYSNFTANITITNGIVGFDYYVFSTNVSGSWVNDTVSISGTEYNASVSKNITQSRDNQVCWYYWANDSAGNTNSSSTYCFTVVNSIPVITALAGAHYPLDNTAMRAYWRFDNDVNDYTANSVDLKYISDNATHTFEGRVGKGYTFEGGTSGGLRCYNHDAGNCADKINNVINQTISIWFKPRNIHYGMLFHQGYATTLIRVYTHSNNYVYAEWWHNHPNNKMYLVGGTYNPNEWNHILAVRDINSSGDVNSRMFLNGVEVDDTPTCVGDGCNWTMDYFGGWYIALGVGCQASTTACTSTTFNGSIDEVTIWNKTFTDSEIADIYNSTRGAYGIKTNFDLGCGINTSDLDDDNLTNYEIRWYNKSAEITSLANLSDIDSGNTTKGENWTCEVRVYDGIDHSLWDNSTNLTIEEAVPTIPVLDLLIDNANTSDTTPFFNWTISTDADEDSITYGIQIANDTGFGAENIVQSNYSLTDNNYTAAVLTEDVYYWRVKAITSDANSSYTSYRTFTIGTTIPTFTNASNTSVDFKKYSNFTANISIIDGIVGLDYYIFSTNVSGSWVNDTVDISGLTYNASVSKNITQSRDNQVCWYYWANDTAGNSNSSSTYCFTVVNTLPEVTLISPANGASVTDRTPLLNWSGTDPDEGDTLSYELNLTLVPSSLCTDPNLNQSGISDSNYTPSNYLKCLYDNGDYYTWKVRASDDGGTTYGGWSGLRIFNVTGEIIISLPVNVIEFGTMDTSETKNTSTNNPAPFELQNDGNCLINISINATQLFTTIAVESDNYKYKIDNKTGEEGSFDWAVTTWQQMPITTSETAIADFNWSDLTDIAEIDLFVVVPFEVAGSKSTTVSLTASLSE